MYKNIIFDLGRVLLNFNPEEYLKKKNIEVERISEVYKEIFQSEEWIMLDKGIITEEDAKKIIINRSINNTDLIELAFENWYEILTPIDGTVEILKELKDAEYKLYFLSNFHLLAFEYVTKMYDFFKLFNGGVVSYEEKLLKPEEAIYKKIIEKYNLKPEESIFIDDVKENVEGARRVNIRSILFTNPGALREELRAYGVNIE
ncbi:MAG: HAD family phosphatase [Bacillota bacterium]|nr:HAD family phosphatase [Bacillota bacterium]